MDTIKFGHTSVLLYETVGSLNIIPGGCYVDGTLGGAGHAFEVCKRLGNGRLIPAKQWYRPEEKVLRASAVFRSPVKDVSSLWRAARFEIPK